MVPQWIIEKKRDGAELAPGEIQDFIGGYAAGAIPDYQMAALAMAITLRSMTAAETVALTRAMLESGATLDTDPLRAKGLPVIDKHSTGGVGDKISLPLAPLAACCGLAVPMMAGRGLGLTGGTIDKLGEGVTTDFIGKLEAIPGYRCELEPGEFLRVLETCGCSIVSAMDRVAPADKKLYGLRDVTGTVPSVPLITASILCKKLAVHPDGLVLDVKWGRGAFMKTRPAALTLARALLETGRALGLRMAALLTDMNQPLGRAVGNAVEVAEAIAVLRGNGPPDVTTLTLELGARMLVLGKAAADRRSALPRLRRALDSGAAFERFKTMVRLHGGDPRALDEPARLPAAACTAPLPAARAGVIRRVDAEAVGRAVILLGGGRTRAGEAIDPGAGMTGIRAAGERIEAGAPLAVLHAGRPERLDEARAALRDAFEIGNEPAPRPPLIARELAAGRGEEPP